MAAGNWSEARIALGQEVNGLRFGAGGDEDRNVMREQVRRLGFGAEAATTEVVDDIGEAMVSALPHFREVPDGFFRHFDFAGGRTDLAERAMFGFLSLLSMRTG